MVRVLRIVVALVGLTLVIASSVLTWVHVDIDTDAVGGLAGDVIDDNVVLDGDAADLIDDAGDIATAARDLIPDRLWEATLNGQNAWDLFGLGFVLVALAAVAAVCNFMWAVLSAGWLRWIGLLCAVLLVATAVLSPLAIIATDTALDTFLPEDWKQFSPSFELTTAPLITVGGSVLVFLSLLGRSPRSEQPAVWPAPPTAGTHIAT